MNQIKNLFERLRKNQNPYLWALVSSIIFAAVVFVVCKDNIAVAFQLFFR